MDILLTNDDGIHAVGLRALYAALTQAGHDVHVVAPLTEQSAVGHAVTLSSPLRVKAIQENGFNGLGVSGTPADCVKLALSHLLKTAPQLIISGINCGANVGVDILYSGTVSAATEGALGGIPAVAASVDDFSPINLLPQAEFTAELIGRGLIESLPARCVLNLNFPACAMAEIKGVRCCPQTDAVYRDWYDERKDPRGGRYYWLCGVIPKENVRSGTDRDMLSQGYITLTPLRFDFTDQAVLTKLEAKFDA